MLCYFCGRDHEKMKSPRVRIGKLSFENQQSEDMYTVEFKNYLERNYNGEWQIMSRRFMCDRCYANIHIYIIRALHNPCQCQYFRTKTNFKCVNQKISSSETANLAFPLESDMIYITHGMDRYSIHKKCDEHLEKCPNCNEYVFKYQPDMYDKVGKCMNCLPVNGHLVDSHNHRPLFNFLRTDKDKLDTRLFGVELEFFLGMDTNRNQVATIYNELLETRNYPEFYIKHDGSIQPGFEVVTFPMTRAYMQDTRLLNRIVDPLQKLVPELEHLVGTHANCGIHVHTNRDILSPLHQWKIGMFVFTNRSNFQLLGRRRWNRYCGSAASRYLANRIISRGGHDERYTAVNYTNRETIEFRFFKGTSDVPTILSYVEVVDSVCDYTRDISITDAKFSGYCSFVTTNKKKYPHLYTVMKSCQFDEDISMPIYGSESLILPSPRVVNPQPTNRENNRQTRTTARQTLNVTTNPNTAISRLGNLNDFTYNEVFRAIQQTETTPTPEPRLDPVISRIEWTTFTASFDDDDPTNNTEEI